MISAVAILKARYQNWLCACNGDKCEGSCRDEHLHRKRNWTNPKDTCPAAFKKQEQK